jgi:hypothetical protein
MTVGKKINIQVSSVLKGGPSVECATFYLNLGWTVMSLFRQERDMAMLFHVGGTGYGNFICGVFKWGM